MDGVDLFHSWQVTTDSALAWRQNRFSILGSCSHSCRASWKAFTPVYECISLTLCLEYSKKAEFIGIRGVTSVRLRLQKIYLVIRSGRKPKLHQRDHHLQFTQHLFRPWKLRVAFSTWNTSDVANRHLYFTWSTQRLLCRPSYCLATES